jgi:RNase P/RNase MRP subunit POP5
MFCFPNYFMKSLKPSMREKKRYLLVKTSDGKGIENIEKAILDFVGVLGMSKTGFGWIKKGKNSAVISVNRGMVDSVRASLCVWPEKMTVERVSGTLKGLKK